MIDLLKLADEFDKAKRMGNDKDVPEGSGYIQISDTLAKQISNELREYVADIEHKEILNDEIESAERIKKLNL